MASPYNPNQLETKWRKRWDDAKVYRSINPGDKDFSAQQPHYYVLDMFPYPSGSGLHVGHASGYIGTDIIARRKRMEGFNVLHPMGWDAFGLPAEQYAIQTGQQPRATTDTNTANFRRQLELIGLSYDWSREFDTSDPKYYKWTQWIFLQLYNKGLVYRKEMPVWWCEDLKTVLANEEVINGRSERGNHPCERRMLTQWVFKITEYADRLLEDLALLDWPESIKKQQRDWIGRSTGAELEFAVSGSQEKIKVFTTRPDTLFGVTAIVLAPEHPLAQKLAVGEHKAATDAYIKLSASKSDRERKAEANDFTAQFIGAYCEHPLLPGTDARAKVPIYVADYVLYDYGTGAVMAVPAHDDRDYKLAVKYKLPILKVITQQKGGAAAEGCFVEDGFMTNSAEFDGLNSEEGREKVVAKLEKIGVGRKRISYKLRDWIFSRQRYWGEPFPLLIDENDQVIPVSTDELPIELPPMADFKPSADGSSPLNRVPEWVNVKDKKTGKNFKRVTDTMPGWAGSCWYYLRFMDPQNSKEAFSKAAVQYWREVDLYVGGASHAVMHLLYARFWHKVLFDLGLVPTPEPFKKLFNQGMVTAYAFKDASGRLVAVDDVEPSSGGGYTQKSTGAAVEKFNSKMAKSLKNVVTPDEVIADKGCDVFRMYSMFLGPLEAEKPWTNESIAGCDKFIKRLWAHFTDVSADDNSWNTSHVDLSGAADIGVWRSLHKALNRVNNSFENFNFNTAVAAMMECLNEIQEAGKKLNQEQIEFYLKMLSPLAPFIASEMWERLGHKDFIDHAEWPKLNPEMLVQSDFELVLQVNGKLRKRLKMQLNPVEAEVVELGKKELADYLAGKAIVKAIYVPNKLLNIVVK